MFCNKKFTAIIFAILAAAIYAVSTPVSKVLLQTVSPTMVAAFLYLGAGVGMGVLILGRKLNNAPLNEEKLSLNDLPYTVAMVVLDIAAPILMMYGLKETRYYHPQPHPQASSLPDAPPRWQHAHTRNHSFTRA